MKKLIIYYSRTGENYFNGEIVNVKKGNTEIVAEMIQKLTGANMFKAEQAVPYSDNYKKCIEQAREDRDNKKYPELKKYLEDISEYEIIYIGFPSYYGTLPMALQGQLKKLDFTGKTVMAFCTHEGSGMGNAESDLRKLCPGAEEIRCLPVHGSNAANSESMLELWILR